MESGLDGRNNQPTPLAVFLVGGCVSMESGLDGRNNAHWNPKRDVWEQVSMESGLDGRNNTPGACEPPPA